MLQLIDSLSVTSGRFGYSGTGRAISDSQPLRRWIGSTRVFTALVCFVRGTRWGNNENVPQACFVIWCGDFSDVWFFWPVLNSTRGFYFTRFTRQFLEGHEHAKHAMDVRRSIGQLQYVDGKVSVFHHFPSPIKGRVLRKPPSTQADTHGGGLTESLILAIPSDTLQYLLIPVEYFLCFCWAFLRDIQKLSAVACIQHRANTC